MRLGWIAFHQLIIYAVIGAWLPYAPIHLHALGLDVPSLIVVPIDYSLDVAIDRELGTETVAT